MDEESCAEQLPRAVEHGRVEEHPHLIIINISTGAGGGGDKATSASMSEATSNDHL